MTLSGTRSSAARLRNHIAAVALVLCGGPALGQKPANVTQGEVALLPEYCPDTQGFSYGDRYSNTSPRAAHWVGLMGPSFWAHHHYCWGLIKMHRALEPGLRKELRQGGLESAVGDFQYVVGNSSPDFIMLPEVFLKMGDAYVLMGSYGVAREAYASARSKKPDYWPAYVRWAEVLAKIGNKQEALSHLEECLRLTPRQPALQEAYRRFGGNLDTFLRSLPPTAPTAPQAPASAASG